VAAAACAQPCRKASGSGATPNDVLFRLATLGSAELEKRGFDRITYGSVHAPMPPMGFAVKTSDDLWKIMPSSVRSILLEPILPKKWFLQG